MRVFKLNFRTPGIFLDEEGGNFKGNLTFEINRNSDSNTDDRWININEDPKVTIMKDPELEINSILLKLETGTIKVPKRNDKNVTYYIIVDDEDAFYYRILADACPDCGDFFIENGETGRLLDNNKWGRIVVGNGHVPASQPI